MPSRRALIVEDNPKDQERVKGLLDARKYDYDVVDSPLKAEIKLKERDYLFVILDLDLGASVDEGKFLLDMMLRENLRRPTIILSNSGLDADTVALKGKYKFIHTSIEKKNLHKLLQVFDDALEDIAARDGQPDEKRTPARPQAGPQVFTLWGTMLAFLLAFVIVVGVVVAAARLVPPLQLAMVLISIVLLYLLLAALVLKLLGGLTQEGLLEIVGKIIGALPLLRNQGSGAAQDRPQSPERGADQ